jgi:hypothetical protein
LAIPAAGSAAPICVVGTLVDYISLGSAGCALGSATLSDFSAAASPAGGTLIAPASITVTPTALGNGHQLEFGLGAFAGPNDLFGVLIGYTSTGFEPEQANLLLAGSAATPPVDPLDTGGVVAVIEDLCLGGMFAPFPACTGSPASQIVLHDALGAIPASSLLFGPVGSFFDVFVDITVDGGTGGTASLTGPVTVQAVPEPATVALFTMALGAIGIRLRRGAPAGGHCA